MTNGQHLLFYRNPARCWEEALPLGNGRIGAMVYVATYCIGRGGSYAGGLGIKTNGWKVWEYRLTFKCTR